MKMFVEPNEIYLHCGYVDFRKSINGLLVIIEHELALSPIADALLSILMVIRDTCKWMAMPVIITHKRHSSDAGHMRGVSSMKQKSPKVKSPAVKPTWH